MAVSWAITPPSGVETTFDYTASTDVRDVSAMLDAVYVADTPLVNRVGWGPAIHNKVHEWITDNIGYGYVVLSNGGTVASDASSFVVGTSGLGAQSLAMRQLHTGTILKYNNQSADVGWMVVEDLSIGGGSVVFAYMSGATAGTALTDAATLFIVGNAVNEGSSPRQDTTRPRTICSNKTQIFRQDVRMTGTRQAIQMYAVANELRHQINLRTKEYKRELESTLILGKKDAGSSTETQTMGGIYDFLRTQTAMLDSSTNTLTESAINDLAQKVFDKGGEPNTLLLGPKQARIIPTLERARVRVTQDSRVAGFYVTRYMTDLGVEMSLLISRWVPKKFAFILDINKLKLMPLAGRKFILEKLGKKGDYVEWQLISEATLEFKGYNLGQHAAFDNLS